MPHSTAARNLRVIDFVRLGLGASGGYTDRGRGSVVASYTLVINRREKPPQMIARLTQGAAAGDTEAQFNLGRIYHTGFNDAPRDEVRARGYFKQAALAGHAPSQANYGYFLDNGVGGPADKAEASRWMKTAAAAGNSFGQALYGLSIAISDDKTALRYLTPAAEAGELAAQATGAMDHGAARHANDKSMGRSAGLCRSARPHEQRAGRR